MRLTVLIGLMLAASITIGAQGETPKCDELCQEYITAVVLVQQTEQLAADTLKQTEEWKTYERVQKQRTQLQSDRTAKIEKRYPGFTVDWTKRTLIPKPSTGK